ncbi:MAG: DUF1566 domain-containing protein [Actinomycetota bacterium]|nr:DUF1566 domain-containing protein [Actinomycetota bacterium]
MNPLRSRRGRLPAVLLALAMTAGGILAMSPAAPAQEGVPELRPAARVKCVNVNTGFARYSSNGRCRSNERVQARSCARGGACVVGDVGPGRGRVFYSARTAQPWGRYLEAAPSSWYAPTGDPNLAWCQDVTTRLPGTDGAGLGDGKANTAAMLAVCTSGAAAAVQGYRGGGKADWYLPSKTELRQLFLHQKKVGAFIFHGYWSSTQASENMAWIQDFYSDYVPAPSDKAFANYVRPVRAFG